MLTREYPPEVYGGGGVHVEFLTRELRRLVDVEVHCFGSPRTEAGVFAYTPPAGLAGANPALRTIGVDLEIADAVGDLDVLHSHTWYANLAGVLGATLHGRPHVLTAHSLEPQRPWKVEQLGGGYGISSWVERQAYETASAIIAVSYGMRADVLDAYPFVDPARVHVVHNGIDTSLYAPSPARDVLSRYQIALEPPVRAVRRPDHSTKGPLAPAGRRCVVRSGRAAHPVRGGAGHTGDRRRDSSGGRVALVVAIRGRLDPRHAPPG